MSIHIWKSMERARSNGAYAGDVETMPIWQMSKRELGEDDAAGVFVFFGYGIGFQCHFQSSSSSMASSRPSHVAAETYGASKSAPPLYARHGSEM